MAYLDTTRPVRRAKSVPRHATIPGIRTDRRPVLLREIDLHTHQAQQMLVAGLLAAGTILAVAGAMLIRM
jgi:hypothetical protein